MERERERERERALCVCVCEREREREREGGGGCKYPVTEITSQGVILSFYLASQLYRRERERASAGNSTGRTSQMWREREGVGGGAVLGERQIHTERERER